MNFVDCETIIVDKSVSNAVKNSLNIYFDGSFSSTTNIAGGACFIENVGVVMRSRVEGKQTNNRGELMGLLLGLNYVLLNKSEFKNLKDIQIFGDSKWVMNSVLKTWKAKENLDMLKIIWEMCDKISEFSNIHFYHVKGHSGIQGNEICDKYSKF